MTSSDTTAVWLLGAGLSRSAYVIMYPLSPAHKIRNAKIVKTGFQQ